jgi:DNA excision repair protein ERCC-3
MAELDEIRRSIEDSLHRLDSQLRKMQEEWTRTLNQIEKQISERRKEIQRTLAESFSLEMWTPLKKEHIEDFVRKPYLIRQVSESEFEVIVPRFIDLYPGALVYQTESYNVFRVNRYIPWIFDIPEPLKQELDFEEPDYRVRLEGDIVVVEPEEKLDDFLKKHRDKVRRTKRGLVVLRGKKFPLILALVKEGILPYTPREVDSNDLTGFEAITLRDYQREHWEKFLKYGHVGVFDPYGAGKSMFGLYALGAIRGDKLVVVSNLTLAEQWYRRILEYLKPIIRKALASERMIVTDHGRIFIVTYLAGKKEWVRKHSWSLVVLDEVHHLPSNVYSIMAALNRKYSVSLSGSPYREDGRSEFIYALSGFPLGTDWKRFYELKIVNRPKVRVILTEDKLKVLDSLMEAIKGKVAIFCDSLKLGRKISKRYGVPFIHGATRNRVKVAAESDVFVISRVGDEGLSLPDLSCTIEVDFLYGSRRQSSQRVGRLFHSTDPNAQHIVLMTHEEYKKYRKRLYALIEKGIEVNVEVWSGSPHFASA